MTALTGIPRTLLFTLRARAEEHRLAERLFADPVAGQWYASAELDADAAVAMSSTYSPLFQLGTAVRTKLYDNITTQFLQAHPDGLIVELGAGLSTRVYRLAHLGGRWIALDLPQAIDFRQQIEGDTAVAKQTHIAISLFDPNWQQQLPATNPKNILFIAEAVLFFLAPTDIQKVIATMRINFPGARLAFDVLTQQFSPKARARFLAADAPIQWLLKNEQDLASFDLSIQEQWVVTHVYLQRWQALGLQPERLLAGKTNIIFYTRLDYNG